MESLQHPSLYADMKCVIITGATSGIGRALAESLHKDGKKVIACGRRRDRLEEIAKSNKGMIIYELDVADRKSCEDFAKKVVEENPTVDTLINNAGVSKEISFNSQESLSEEDWSEEISINIMGLIRLINLLVPHFKTLSNATIINVSSGLALGPLALCPVYCATKSFVHSFTRSLRHQFHNTPIRVVEIIPPAVNTELNPKFRARMGEEFVNKIMMPLVDFNNQAVEKLKNGELEFGIGSAHDRLKPTQEQEMKAFRMMNPISK